MNSKLSEWYFSQISTSSGMGTTRWKKYKIERLPVKKMSEEEQHPFVQIVEKILEIKKGNPDADTTTLEKQIDRLVYQLYGLTKDEVKIIENSITPGNK
jgi:hypothetical protein